MARIHVTDVGTCHADPHERIAWTLDHVEWYADSDVVCDLCGRSLDAGEPFALCLDGGDTLCLRCAEVEGVKLVECNCQ